MFSSPYPNYYVAVTTPGNGVAGLEVEFGVNAQLHAASDQPSLSVKVLITATQPKPMRVDGIYTPKL